MSNVSKSAETIQKDDAQNEKSRASIEQSVTSNDPPKPSNNATQRDDGPDAFPESISDDAWSACTRAIRQYDEKMIKGWKEDIDTLLVFAGLFSAVVTAFNIESYRLLQQDPADTTAQLLAQISLQLNSFQVNNNYVNSTAPASPTLPGDDFHADTSAVRLNIFWFLSLVFSLVAASMAIILKTWLNQYADWYFHSSSLRDSIRLRQFRFTGLRKWGMFKILTLVPLILQGSLVLFFIGLIELLWTLHRLVAAIISASIGFFLLFIVGSTVLPIIARNCPYRSPPAWGVFLMAQFLAVQSRRYLLHLSNWIAKEISRTSSFFSEEVERMWHATHLELERMLSVSEPQYATWREREEPAIIESQSGLDRDVLVWADATFVDMDVAFLENVIRPCISNMDTEAAVQCMNVILHRRIPNVFRRSRYRVKGRKEAITLSHIILDLLASLNDAVVDDPIALELCLIRYLVPLSLTDIIHFESDLVQQHTDTLIWYLNKPPTIRGRVFSILWRLYNEVFEEYSSHRVSYSVTGIEKLISFARSCAQTPGLTEKNDFIRACDMVLSLLVGWKDSRPSSINNTCTTDINDKSSSDATTESHLPLGTCLNDPAYASLRIRVQDMLKDLEEFFTTFTTIDGAAFANTPFVVNAWCSKLRELAEQDPSLISPGLVKAFRMGAKGGILKFWRNTGGDKWGIVKVPELAALDRLEEVLAGWRVEEGKR